MSSSNKLITWQKRLAPSPTMTVAVTVSSILLALLFGSVLLISTGFSPLEVYHDMFTGAYGSTYGLSETIVKAIPLMLAGLGVSIAFRMQLWNIGAEGQFYMGAFGASGLALAFPSWPGYILLPLMVVAGCAMGGLWALLSAVPKAKWNVNEVITTLMLNYVAILWVDYLVYGPWKDPQGHNFPLSARFSPGATLPAFGNTRVHLGLVFAIVAAAIIYLALRRTRWGFEIRVIGENSRAASYAGMNIRRNVLLAMFISGALAGLAGMSEVAGITHRIQHDISPGYGYTAVIIAWLAKLHPVAIVLVSVLFGGLIVGGYTVQTSGVPSATVYMLQGAILFFVLGSEIVTHYRIHFGRKEEE